MNVSKDEKKKIEADIKARLQEMLKNRKNVSQADYDKTLGEIIELMIKGGINWLIRPQFGIGEVDDDKIAHSVQFSDPQFGSTNKLRSPFVASFHIKQERELLGPNVDSRIKKYYFPDDPEFWINLVSSSGSVFPSTFCDPRSNWYDVFLGYYDMVCYKDKGWKRPFGYVKSGDDWVVSKKDFVFLCSADWNVLSNFTYGVPWEEVEKYLPEPQKLDSRVDELCKYNGRVQAFKASGNNKYFDEIELTGVPATSPYESKRDGAKKLNWENVYFTIFWMMMFGLPLEEDISEQFPDSFPESKMTGKEWVYTYETEDAYHTVIFGGFGNDGNPPSMQNKTQDFIKVQQKAVGDVATAHYSNFGYDSATSKTCPTEKK